MYNIFMALFAIIYVWMFDMYAQNILGMLEENQP